MNRDRMSPTVERRDMLGNSIVGHWVSGFTFRTLGEPRRPFWHPCWSWVDETDAYDLANILGPILGYPESVPDVLARHYDLPIDRKLWADAVDILCRRAEAEAS